MKSASSTDVCRRMGAAVFAAFMLVLLLPVVAPTTTTTTVGKRPRSSSSSYQPWTTSRSAPALLVQQIPRGGGAAAAGKAKRVAPAVASRKLTPSKNDKKKVSVGGGSASPSSLVFNLVKAILGVGVLSLPAGIANFGNAPSAVIPALVLIAVMGSLSGYGFAVIGKVCSLSGGAGSYREAWSASVGPKTSWIPAASTTFKTFFACLAISMVLADTFVGLLRRNPSERAAVLATLTVTLLLPLCWMKNLSALAPFSLVGILGMLYTGMAMTLRYLDGSYAVGGALHDQVPVHWQPFFGDAGWQSVGRDPRALILVCMLSTAYMAHFIAPKVYQELENNTLPRYYGVVSASFGISITLFCFITAVGFLTFGGNSAGLILNNYAANDVWMSLSKVAVAVSLVFSYPLVFTGCRDGLLDLLGVSPEKKSQNNVLNTTTLVLLAVVTSLAAVLKDVSLVLAVAGATLGNALTYVYPALMYNSIVRKQKKEGESVGLMVANASAVLGIVMGVIGTKLALEK